MLPSVTISRADGQTGVVRPSEDGVCAILAPCQSGTFDTPASYTRRSDVLTDFGYGALSDFASYVLPVAGKPVLLVRSNPSTAGAYGTLTITGAGTAAPVAGATEPLDDYSVLVTFVAGGALGTAGITYTYSLDGGKSTSKVQALGTALTLSIPNSGVSLTLGVAADTILAGETVSFTTTGPTIASADITNALTAIENTSNPWEALLVHGDADATLISAIDTWLAGLESKGKYRFAVLNFRAKTAAETEADYSTALAAVTSAVSSTRIVLCADGGYVTSPLTGLRMSRPTSLGIAARAMAIDISEDPANVADGPIAGYSILDDRGNLAFHDESANPGLDDLKATTLRTFERRAGAYCTNANVISPDGSDYVYIQHVRVMNRACEITFDVLTTELSKGVEKKTTADPVTGAVYITEESAAGIEAQVQAQLNSALKGRVSGVKFTLSRTDDLSSNAGATLTGTLAIESLAYVKKFAVTSQFTKSISTAA